MSLVDEIVLLRDECLASLDASHNYHVHTQHAWRLVEELIQNGYQANIHNQETGNIVNEIELSNLAQVYVAGYLTTATFQHFVSVFERFIFDLLRVWLIEYPGSLVGKQLSFRTVIDAKDKKEIVAAVVQKEVVGLTYQKVADWFAYLEKLAQLGCPTEDQIQKLAEIKASRDVLVHNNGIANAIYVSKSGSHARFADGEILELPEYYHRESWQLIKQIVADVTDAGVKKLAT